MDIYREMLRWWDYWLKGIDNGLAEELESQPVQTFVREWEPPHPGRTDIAGEWRGAKALPPQPVMPAPTLQLSAGGDGELKAGPPRAASGSDSVAFRPGACLNGGVWDAGGSPPAIPGPQNRDETAAINFTSSPLEEELFILGIPTFSLTVSFDGFEPEAMEVAAVAVRLCEVGTDGTSVLVSKGLLNATRRESMAEPKPLPSQGTTMLLQFHLEGTCWRFAEGHRLRLSINGSDFPNVSDDVESFLGLPCG